jgi:class 3 adenylate cyclase
VIVHPYATVGGSDRILRSAERRGVGDRSTTKCGHASALRPVTPEDRVKTIEQCIRVESKREVRAGLHTGECEVIGEKLGGIAVHIGARVAALARPGEVLVSNTVKDLVAGSGLAFEERGAHSLKGVPGEWRLYAVTPAA